MSESPVRVTIPAALRALCGGQDEVLIAAGNVRALLSTLGREHPDLHRRICEDTGVPRTHINVFVNEEHIRWLAGLDTPLKATDVVTILPAVSGG